jgi:hypothetical protein
MLSLLSAACLLAWAGPAGGRSLDFWESYSLSVHGGLTSPSFYNAGLQLMTLDGAGDSSWLMSHVGIGLDLAYAHDGPGTHHLRIVPAVEYLFLWFYAQAGVGAFADCERAERWGVDLMFSFGLRLFLGDEYEWFSVSTGGRLDYLARPGYAEFIPGFMARLSFYID